MDIKFYFSCLAICLSFMAFDAQAYPYPNIGKWAFIFNYLMYGVEGAHSVGDEESDEELPSQPVPLERLEEIMKSAAVKSLKTLLVEMKDNKKVGNEKYIDAMGTLLDEKNHEPLSGIIKELAEKTHTEADPDSFMNNYYWFMEENGMLSICLSVGEDKSVSCYSFGAATDQTEAECEDESEHRIKFKFRDPDEKMRIRFP